MLLTSYIKDSSFFKDEYLIDTSLRDNANPKCYFSWIKKDYAEDEENKKLEDQHDKGNTYDIDKSETD